MKLFETYLKIIVGTSQKETLGTIIQQKLRDFETYPITN